MLEWVVRETIQQMDAQTEAQEEEERAAQRRFIPLLDYGDEPPARSPSMAQYLD
jgi:hypothetical protein